MRTPMDRYIPVRALVLSAFVFASILVGLSLTSAQEVIKESTLVPVQPQIAPDAGAVVDSVMFIKRPKSFDSLETFAASRFGVDPEQIEDALADNHPAVVFTVFIGGRRIDHLLVDEGNRIVHYIHSLPTPNADVDDSDSSEESRQSQDVSIQVASCEGHHSANNPCICDNRGNCVWWCWKKMADVWGQQFRTCRHAKYWATEARTYGWPVSNDPGSRAVAVDRDYSAPGHTVWVEYLRWNEIFGSEMMYGVSGVNFSAKYPVRWPDQGFIFPKPTATRPQVTGSVAPTMYAGGTYRIMLSGSNFGGAMIVDVNSPLGDWVSLRGSQVQVTSSTAVWITATLGARGWWRFRLVAPNGQRSDYTYRWVN